MNNFSSLSKLLSSQKHRPEPAFLCDNNEISFLEFHAAVGSLSEYLQQSKQNEWVLYCQDTFLFAIGFFALLHSKKTIILPHNIKPKNLENLDAQIGSLEFLFEDDITTHQQNSLTKNYHLSQIDAPSSQIIFSTSGSTGTPKLVHKNLQNLEEEIKELQKLFADDLTGKIFAATVSHQHIYGLLFRLLFPLCTGDLIYSTTINTIEELTDLTLVFQNIVLISSPAFLKRLPSNISVSDINIFSSGGLLKKLDAQNCAAVFGDFPIEILGSTETGGVAWRTQKNSEIWNKFSPVKIKIGDQNCLLIKSPYINGGDFIAMGDAANLLDKEHFILQGRIDRVVKIEEKRITLDEIENNLLAHQFVSNCCAVILEGKTRQIIGVALELKKLGEAFLRDHNKTELNGLFRQHLLQYSEMVVIPRKWRYVKNIPINSQGKILTDEIKILFTNENSDR